MTSHYPLPVILLALCLPCATAAEKGGNKDKPVGDAKTQAVQAGATNKDAPAREDQEDSKPVKIASNGAYEAFLMARILPLLKEEKFDKALTLAERAIAESPALDEWSQCGLLWMIAQAKAVTTVDEEFAVRFLEKLGERFPATATAVQRKAMSAAVLADIKERRQALGTGHNDEVSPPE